MRKHNEKREVLIKKFINRLIDFIFFSSLVLLSKFDLDSFGLEKYQVVAVVFWVTGIFKYKNPENSTKETIFDSMQEFLIAILIIPFWYWISGEIVYELYAPIIVLMHICLLMVYVLVTKKIGVKDCGTIAYYTSAVIPIIAIVLIRLGVPIEVAVLIAVITPEPINFYFYGKKIIKSS